MASDFPSILGYGVPVISEGLNISRGAVGSEVPVWVRETYKYGSVWDSPIKADYTTDRAIVLAA